MYCPDHEEHGCNLGACAFGGCETSAITSCSYCGAPWCSEHSPRNCPLCNQIMCAVCEYSHGLGICTPQPYI